MPKPQGLFLGKLERQYLINAQDQVYLDRPGGNLLYAAAAFSLWDARAGLVARVGADYPEEWLADFQRRGLDTEGVERLPEDHDLNSFTAYTDVHTALHDRPIPHFARLGMPVPKALLSYEPPKGELDSRKKRPPLSLRAADLPKSYKGVRAAHLCPLDYYSHSLMPTTLREAGVEMITVNSSPGYMHSSFWNELPSLVNGLSAFITEEGQLRNLFGGRVEDVWQMAEYLASFHCAAVVIRRGARGQFLFDGAAGVRYRIPAYPAQPKDITHEESSYCGGFLAGLLEGGDVLHAALTGSATASIATESSGAFSVLESLKGLAESRRAALTQAVQQV